VRTYTVQALTRRGLEAIGPSVVALAEAEGLAAHADSIRMRLGGCPRSPKAELTPDTR
jgi:histidinol dehydrogenase